MKTQWSEICTNLQARLDPGTYKVWVAPLIADMDGNDLRLTAPNTFVANWVRDRLLKDIAVSVLEVTGHAVAISVVAGTSQVRSASQSAPVLRSTEAANPAATSAGQGGLSYTQQLAFPLERPRQQQHWRYGFESFVVGPANNLAYVAAQNVSQADAVVDTLFLSSGPGLGKTHLSQAAGKALCQGSNRANPKVEYLTAEEFSMCFVHALRARDTERFKNRFREVDLLLLEDVHFLQGKEKMQDEVLATIKALQTRGSRVVLTSSFSPQELKDVDSNLVSRFCSGFMAGIEKPDPETRRRILEEKAHQSNIRLSDPVLDILSARLTGDVRQLEGCVHNLVLKAKMLGSTISVDMAREILAQYVQDTPCLDVDAIIRNVCAGFGLSPDQLTSRSRKQNLVLARNTVFYLARKHTELSLQAIGGRFNRRHSTVLKGIAAVERELRRESPLGRQIARTLTVIERG